MLNNVKKLDRVLLANGLKATVTEVQTGYGWNSGTKTISIRPDGGTYKTRTYDVNGKAYDDSYFNVVKVMAADAATKLEEAKALAASAVAAVKALEETLNKETSDGYEEKMMDFGDGNGPVKARRHLNPQGDFGGYVATTATVSSNVRVGRGSKIFGTAQVQSGAHIKGNSRIGGAARIGPTIIDGLSVIDNRASALAS